MAGGADIPTFATLEDACAFVGILPVNKARAGAWMPTKATNSNSHGAGRIRFFPSGNGGYCKNHATGAAALFFYGYRQSMSKHERERMRKQIRREIAAANEAQQLREEMRRCAMPALCDELLGAARIAVAPYLRLKRVAGVAGAPSRVIELDAARRILQAADPSMYDDGICQGVGGLVGPLLLIPLASASGLIRSVEFIDSSAPSAKKRYLKGAARRGLIWRPEDLPTRSAQVNELAMAEGVATALSVRRLYDIPCIAALDCGSLLAALDTVFEAYPNANVFVMADSDKPTDAAPEGIGLHEARAAAREFPDRAFVRTVPAVTHEQLARLRAISGIPDKSVSDFNDYEIAIKGKAV